MSKKVCLVFNHFQYQDGVCRSAISMANLLAEKVGADVTLIPIYRYDKILKEKLHEKVKVKPVLGFYFKGLSKFVSLLPAKLLYKSIIKELYDVEIAFQYGTPTEFMAASNNNTAKRLVWIHTYHLDDYYRNLYSKYDLVVNVAACNADRFKKEVNNSIPVDFCYNPIDERVIIQQGNEEVFPLSTNHFTLVSVGRHSPEKGYDRLLDICNRLKNEGYLFTLNLIGTGPSHDMLKHKCTALGLDGIVNFLGAQSNPHKYTKKADVFVCSSFSEGYSTACTEAIMLGIPVITTNVSGAMEIIENAECGLLTDLDDESLYLAIKQVLDNPQLVKIWKHKLNSTRKRFFMETRFLKFLQIIGI